MQGESEHVIDALSERMRSLATQQRFEEAASVRDRLSSLLSATTTARLVDAVTSAGHARFTLAGIDHKIDQGLVDLDHLGVIHRFDTSEADTDAERLLVARMIQRAAAQSRTISNVESSGQWRFPLSEPTVERLGSSERDHSLSVNVDDTNLPAGE